MAKLERILRRTSRGRVAAATALLGAGGLIYAREVETRRVEVKSVTLTLPRLAPEFDGYRLVQLGDLHLDDWTRPERLRRITHKVNEQRPDIVAITGDFASYSAEQLDAQRLIDALRALRARDGCVAILGNHDYLTDVKLVRRCIREGGVTELINGVHTLKRDNAALHVAGIDDVMEGRSRTGERGSPQGDDGLRGRCEARRGGGEARSQALSDAQLDGGR